MANLVKKKFSETSWLKLFSNFFKNQRTMINHTLMNYNLNPSNKTYDHELRAPTETIRTHRKISYPS